MIPKCRIRPSLTPFVVYAAILVAANSIHAQQGTREIVSTDFTKNRPAANESSAASSGPLGGTSTKPAPKPRVYRPVSKPITAKGTKPTSTRPNKSSGIETSVAQLGITIWRLRPARPTDTGTRQLVREKSATSEWVPERIASDTLIRAGDRVRLSIESPRNGYLYVVNRDQFADGRSGAINLIFPLAGEDNRVYAGRLIDIPSPESSMKASPAPNQSGEVLSLIVTSERLSLPLTDDVLPISRAQLTEWERLWGGSAEVWEMEGGAGEAWTPQEKQAAAKKGTRQLTRDDPPPQTIYRVSVTDIKAMLVNVRIRYGR
jgi:hypothetical protein